MKNNSKYIEMISKKNFVINYTCKIADNPFDLWVFLKKKLTLSGLLELQLKENKIKLDKDTTLEYLTQGRQIYQRILVVTHVYYFDIHNEKQSTSDGAFRGGFSYPIHNIKHKVNYDLKAFESFINEGTERDLKYMKTLYGHYPSQIPNFRIERIEFKIHFIT